MLYTLFFKNCIVFFCNKINTIPTILIADTINMPNRLKQIVRKTYQNLRRNLSPHYQHSASSRVCKRVSELEPYRHAKRIALYQTINGEIDLAPLWHSAVLHSKYCYFPSLNSDNTLSFLLATHASTFHKNRFGIDEPDPKKAEVLNPCSLDIIFMPLVAFDKRGTRLGMGGGYYDRTLANVRGPLLIGVAYEFQQETFITREEWDIPLDLVVTEKTVYWTKI
jgi:5-formyltetrahydrofolate cyclo-ligase